MVNDTLDPYWKLRPRAATPEDEVCHCPLGVGIMLRGCLTENPLFCVECNGEVPPERLGFDARFAETIAFWLSVYESLYSLWLASGEYETWAAESLSDPQGQVNREGREIVERLNAIVPTYYWWFDDAEVEEDRRLKECPICNSMLEPYQCRGYRVCESCRILA